MSERRGMKTEHAGAKNGGGFWGTRAEAKETSAKIRRERGKDEIRAALADGVPGPAPRVKRYHMAAAMREDGAVSALCFNPPRAIDLRRASWTNRREAVTCPECNRLLAARAPSEGKETT